MPQGPGVSNIPDELPTTRPPVLGSMVAQKRGGPSHKACSNIASIPITLIVPYMLTAAEQREGRELVIFFFFIV